MASGRFCALLTLVPLGVLAFISVHLATNAVRDNAKTQVRQNAAMTVNTFQTALTNATTAISSVAARPALQSATADPEHSRDQIRAQLLELKKGQATSESVFLAGADGRIVQALPENAKLEGIDQSTSEWFRGVSASGKPYVSGAFRSPARATRTWSRSPCLSGHPTAPAGKGSAAFSSAPTTSPRRRAFVDYFSKSLGSRSR